MPDREFKDTDKSRLIYILRRMEEMLVTEDFKGLMIVCRAFSTENDEFKDNQGYKNYLSTFKFNNIWMMTAIFEEFKNEFTRHETTRSLVTSIDQVFNLTKINSSFLSMDFFSKNINENNKIINALQLYQKRSNPKVNLSSEDIQQIEMFEALDKNPSERHRLIFYFLEKLEDYIQNKNISSSKKNMVAKAIDELHKISNAYTDCYWDVLTENSQNNTYKPMYDVPSISMYELLNQLDSENQKIEQEKHWFLKLFSEIYYSVFKIEKPNRLDKTISDLKKEVIHEDSVSANYDEIDLMLFSTSEEDKILLKNILKNFTNQLGNYTNNDNTLRKNLDLLKTISDKEKLEDEDINSIKTTLKNIEKVAVVNGKINRNGFFSNNQEKNPIVSALEELINESSNLKKNKLH